MIKVMQIGYGYWGANISKKLLASPMLELAYLAEADSVRKNAALKQLPKTVTVVDNYYELLTSDIDAVVICTQTEYSFEIAMNAMKHGKHVFTEKPIATTVDRTLTLISMAKENNLILHCDHLMIYNPVVRYIKRLYDAGKIGDIMYIDISRVNLGPIRKDINAMLDLAVHDIAVVDYLIDGLVPDELNVAGAGFFEKQESITYLTMKCRDFIVNINSSWISPVKIRRTVIAGTKKMIVFDDVKMDKLRIYDSGIDVVQGNEYGKYEYQTRVGDIFIPHIENEDSLQNSLEHFSQCVETGRASLSGPEQSLRVMKILEMAQKKLKPSSQC